MKYVYECIYEHILVCGRFFSLSHGIMNLVKMKNKIAMENAFHSITLLIIFHMILSSFANCVIFSRVL